MSTRLPYDPATTVRFAHGTSANERDAEPSVDEQAERLHRRRRVSPKVSSSATDHALPRLIQSARQLDATASLSAGLPLLGAGPGLTPSWDDLLIGFLCGMRAICGSDGSQSRFIDQFGNALSCASAKMTTVSRMYIRRTVEVDGPAWIEDALAAIVTGDSIRTCCATATALRVGHTSGADMMFGAMLASSIWQESGEVDRILSDLSC